MAAVLSDRSRRLAALVVSVFLQIILTGLFAATNWKEQLDAPRFNELSWTVWAIAVLAPLHGFLGSLIAVQADYSQREVERLEMDLAVAEVSSWTSLSDLRFYQVNSRFINMVVSRKLERLLRGEGPDPVDQIDALTTAAWHMFYELVNSLNQTMHRVRVVLFVPDDQGGMEPFSSYDGTSTACVNLEHLPDEARLHFRLDHYDPALVVAASLSGQRHFVPDTEAAANDRTHPFRFFEPSEPENMKSIAAFPVRIDATSPPYSVLIVDTRSLGFFDPTDQELAEKIDFVVGSLSYRLLMEMEMATMEEGEDD